MSSQELTAIQSSLSGATRKDRTKANAVLVGVTIAFSLLTVYFPVSIHQFTAVSNPIVKGIVFTSIMWSIAAIIGTITMRRIGKLLDPYYTGWKEASQTKGFHKNAALAGALTAVFVSISSMFASTVSPVIAAALTSLIVLFVVKHDMKTGALPSEKRIPVIALLIVSVVAAALIEVGTSLKLSLLAFPILGLLVNYIRSHAEVLEQKGACLHKGISIQFAFARVFYSALFSTIMSLAVSLVFHDVFRMYAELLDWRNLLSVGIIALCFKFADYGRIYAKSICSVILGLIMISSASAFVLVFNYPAYILWGNLIPGTEGVTIQIWAIRIVSVIVLGLCILGINLLDSAGKTKTKETISVER